MKFGVYLYPPAGGGDPREIVQLALEAERLQFDSAWLGDHIAWPAHFEPGTHDRNVGGVAPPAAVVDLPVIEPLTMLSYVAATVHRIKLGLGVLVAPYRNPVLAAKMLSMLDLLSEGRLIVGVGSGWLEEEFPMLGAPAFSERGRVTDEYLRVFIELWTSPEPQFDGDYATVINIRFNPKPVQQPHPPLWIGGNGIPAIKRAVAYGQGWMPLHQTPLEMKAKVQRLREIAHQEGRDPGEVGVAVGCGLHFSEATGARPERDTLTGTAADIVEQLRRYQDAGVDEVRLLNHGYVTVPDLVGSWDRFLTEVTPHF
ncbi:MAG: LLM class flavin-dependent oxidoreductase [Candidatus Dormibacteria bacterium]